MGSSCVSARQEREAAAAISGRRRGAGGETESWNKICCISFFRFFFLLFFLFLVFKQHMFFCFFVYIKFVILMKLFNREVREDLRSAVRPVADSGAKTESGEQQCFFCSDS